MVQTNADGNSPAPKASGAGRAERDAAQPTALAGVGRTAADAYQAARKRSSAFYGSARDTALDAGRRTAEGIESNPIMVVAGGLALGVLIGALVPASRRERQLFGPVGRRITDTAREAGREQLDDFTERAMETVRASAGAVAESKD
jgi:hypothetical protein